MDIFRSDIPENSSPESLEHISFALQQVLKGVLRYRYNKEKNEADKKPETFHISALVQQSVSGQVIGFKGTAFSGGDGFFMEDSGCCFVPDGVTGTFNAFAVVHFLVIQEEKICHQSDLFYNFPGYHHSSSMRPAGGV